MFQDLLTYAQLKLKLGRTAFLRALSSILFVDVTEERRVEDRLYQIYALLIYGAVCVALWIFLLDFVADIFIAGGVAFTQEVFRFSLVLPLVLLVVLGVSYARSSPWKMSHADISFVAESRLDTRAIIAWEALVQLLQWMVIGFILGYVMGVGLQSGLETVSVALIPVVIDPVVFALFWATLCCLSALMAWVIGVKRLAVSTGRGIFSVVAFTVIAVIVVIAAFVVFFLPPDSLALSLGIAILIGVFLIAVGFILLGRAAACVDVTFAVSENILYADLFTIRHMPLYDASGYAETKQKKRVEKRGPIGSLPIGEGKAALFTRAALSHIRQFEGLFSIAFWAAIVPPMTAVLLTSTQSPFLWVMWLQVIILFSKGVREITRVFRDNLKNRSIGDHLRFNTLTLFVGSSTPAGVIAFAISTVALLVIVPLNSDFLYAFALCTAALVTFVLCAGVDGMEFSSLGKRISYEIVALIAAVGLFLISLSGIPYLALAFMLLYSAGLMAFMRHS